MAVVSDGEKAEPPTTIDTCPALLDTDAPTARLPSPLVRPAAPVGTHTAPGNAPLEGSPAALMDMAVSSPAAAIEPERRTTLLADAVSDSLARAVSVQASPEAQPVLMPELPSEPAAAAAMDTLTLPATAETVA
jgi:hypothetical protein